MAAEARRKRGSLRSSEFSYTEYTSDEEDDDDYEDEDYYDKGMGSDVVDSEGDEGEYSHASCSSFLESPAALSSVSDVSEFES